MRFDDGGERMIDLLIIGAGPTGIAVGAEACRAGLETLLVDRGPLCASLQAYPTDLVFFTTRERMEIADVPLTIPDVKPNRRQALVYYREVVRRYGVPLALYETVRSVERVGTAWKVETVSKVRAAGETDSGGGFVVTTERAGSQHGQRTYQTYRSLGVALATGYFVNPKRLGVDGEDLPWVKSRYIEPYPYFDQHVVIIGAGNSAAKNALDLWRNGARVTLVHRRSEPKPSVKYWIRPDLMNRLAEGSIQGYFDSRVVGFRETDGRRWVDVDTPDGPRSIEADTVFLQIGYLPETDLQAGAGVEIDPESLIPTFDEATCESNVAGLYIAGTLQAGRHTSRIFIENSRDHGKKIVASLIARR